MRVDPLLGAACSASLLGSIWAATSGCNACQKASELIGGLGLAALGVLFYAHLLFVLMMPRARPYFSVCVLFAAGVHLALVALLVRRHIVCPACYLTAAGAFVMAGLSMGMQRRNLRRALIIVPIAATLTVIARPLFPIAGTADITRQKQIRLALAREEAEPAVAAGRTRMIIYSRPACSLCQELRTELLPEIRREFGPTLDIEYRPAWEGLRTPTLIVRGKRRTHLVGLPSLDTLRQAIQFSQN